MSEVQQYETDMEVIRQFGNAAAVHAIAIKLQESSLVQSQAASCIVYPTPIIARPERQPSKLRIIPIALVTVLVTSLIGIIGWLVWHLVLAADAAAVWTGNHSASIFGCLLAAGLLYLLYKLCSFRGGSRFSGTFEGRIH